MKKAVIERQQTCRTSPLRSFKSIPTLHHQPVFDWVACCAILHMCCIFQELILIQPMWESRVETKDYSVVYFNRIAAFEALYR